MAQSQDVARDTQIPVGPIDDHDDPQNHVGDSILPVAAIAAAHLPFLLSYFRNLWLYKPHDEFFPLILAESPLTT